MSRRASALWGVGHRVPVRPRPVRLVVAIVASAIVFFPLYWMLVIAFSPRGEVFA
ncbi:sugar ABC transporter permease, partial [Rathayibacter sp. AY2B7]